MTNMTLEKGGSCEQAEQSLRKFFGAALVDVYASTYRDTDLYRCRLGFAHESQRVLASEKEAELKDKYGSAVRVYSRHIVDKTTKLYTEVGSVFCAVGGGSTRMWVMGVPVACKHYSHDTLACDRRTQPE